MISYEHGLGSIDAQGLVARFTFLIMFFHIIYDYTIKGAIDEKIKFWFPQSLCLFELTITFLSWYFSVSHREKIYFFMTEANPLQESLANGDYGRENTTAPIRKRPMSLWCSCHYM